MTLALIVGGALSANAYTKTDLTSAGWTELTDLSAITLEDNLFVFFDSSSDLMLSLETGVHQGNDKKALFYKTAANPLVDFTKLFAIEAGGSNGTYALRNASLDFRKLQLQTEWNAGWYYRTNDQPNSCQWTRIKLAYAEGSWTIQNNEYSGYLGKWDGGTTYADGDETAANKTGGDIGHYKIYYMAKGDIISKLLNANAPTKAAPTDLSVVTAGKTNTTSGWTKNFENFTQNFQPTRNDTKNTGSYSNWGFLEAWNNSVVFTGTLTTALAYMPNGMYKITAYAFKETTDVISLNGGDNNVSTSLTNTDNKYQEVVIDNVNVTEGNGLTLGLNVTSGTWIGITDIRVSYYGPNLAKDAVALPAGGAMTANTWYYFDITSDSQYDLTATTLDNIVYTKDASILIEDQATITTNFSSTNPVALTAGRYYIKSSSANNFAFEAHVKSYSVGDVTATSIVDNTYLQSLTTVTFTLGAATTNDGTATLAIQGSPVAKLNDGTSDVADGALTISGNVVTATYTSVTLDPAKTYTITLPANAVAWDKNTENKNTAKVITFKTPAVFDGHFYIKKNGADLFFSRGGDDNKQVVLDQFGVPVKITTDANNVTRVKFVDTGLLLGASGSSNMYWTDKGDGTPSTVNWTITKSVDKYKFYLKGMEDAKKGMNIDGSAPMSDAEANACDWELELPADHPAKLQAIKDAQAAAVATAMSIDGVSTQAQMAAKLTADYGETAITITGVNAIQDKYQNSASTGTGSELALFAEETVSGLAPGLYRLRVYGFERIAGGQAVYDAGGAAGLAYVYATSNGATEKVKLASLFDVQSDTQWKSGNDLQFGGKYYANGTEGAQAAFNAGNYANDVYVKVVDEGSGTGSIKFGIKQPNCYYQDQAAHNNGQWICYNNFSLTLFEAKATDGEKTALANAITAAEAKTLGFETGEYAPYANTDALEALAAAKAIDPDNASGISVVAATTALTGATWTANAAEMNAIYWKTDYAAGDKAGDGYVHPIGWTNTGYNTRIMCAANDAASNPAMATIGTAVFSKFNTTYGEQVGYTMPLKAGQLYKISFNYCGWGNTPTTNVVIKRPNGTSVTVENASFKPATNDGNSDATHWYEYTGSFTADVAGDYVLELNKVETGQQQIAWADMQLVKTQEVSANMTITSAKYATFIAPFDVAIPSGVTASKVLAAEDKTLTLTPVETTIPANTPVVLYKDVTGADFTQDFNGADRSTKNTYTVGLLTGVYADTPATPGTYVLQNQSGTVAFYKVTSGNEPTVGKNRAYVNAGAFGAGIKAFFFDEDETTAIEGLDVLTSGEYDAIYNAAGIQVEALQKGLNIVVKDGKSYKIYVK